MTKAQKAFDFITDRINNGFTVMISNHMKSTQVSPKTFAGFAEAGKPFVKIGKDGDLYMVENGKYVCIATKDIILNRISAF